ncbi:MAG TPA: outer membrane protein assembly factor BamA, partial [Chthoniobacterales bacterium]|nr:outer membrane protein assembly factor BamA [Chthoniobacterales bacterium]
MKNLTSSIRLAAVLLSLGLITALAPGARAQGVEGVVINSIDVRYVGPETVSKDRVLANMRTKVGAPYSEATVEDDIRALYDTGKIQNVRIFGEPKGNGVHVQVILATRALVTEIEIDGAQSFKAKTLRGEIKFKVPSPADAEKLEEGRQNIIDFYQRKGFTGVDVQLQLVTDESRGTARAVYTVKEGEKGAVREIVFQGNTKFSDRTLRKQMKTKAKTPISILDKSGRLDQTQLQQDLDSIREFYQNKGYIDIAIPEVRQERFERGVRIVVVINEGILYHVGKVTFQGQEATSEARLHTLIKMKPGTIYTPKGLKDDTKAIIDGYGAGGYVDVDLLPQGVPAGPGVVDLSYTITEGSRSFVERVNITGNTRTKDKVIRREILTLPGDVFDTVRVDVSKKRLENLGYFEKVETYPEDTNIPGRKDLLVQVQEKRTGALNFGAGFSTIESLLGFVELTQSNFDLFNYPSFTGGGQKFRLRVQYGTQESSYLLSLTEPYFLDQRFSLGTDIFYREASFLSSVYDQRNYGFAIDARKPLSPFLSVDLNYRLQEIDIFNVALGSSPEILAEEGDNLKSEITPSFVYDTRDSVYLTRHGHRISFTPHIAGGFLGGTVQTYGFDLEASQYFLFPYDIILTLNGETAVIDNWGSGDHVPIFDRLFLGGANDLRGFNFRDVGPKDMNGEPLGGNTLARFTIETTIKVIDRVRAAVFYDTGFINADSYDFGTSHLASDVGVGVRLDLPIGPLKIDYGIPIQKDNNSGGGKVQFSVGYQ